MNLWYIAYAVGFAFTLGLYVGLGIGEHERLDRRWWTVILGITALWPLLWIFAGCSIIYYQIKLR